MQVLGSWGLGGAGLPQCRLIVPAEAWWAQSQVGTIGRPVRVYPGQIRPTRPATLGACRPDPASPQNWAYRSGLAPSPLSGSPTGWAFPAPLPR